MEDNEQAAAQGGGENAKLAEPPVEARVDPIFAWLVFFTLGGGLLALYYGEIGYFPDFTWEDSLTYLALMAIVGGSLALAYFLLLLIPGAIWSEFLICDPGIQSKLTLRKSPVREPCVLRVMERIVFPFALFMVFCHSLLGLREKVAKPEQDFYIPFGVASSLVALSALLWLDFGGVGEPTESRSSTRWRSLWSHRGVLAVAHLLVLLGYLAGDFPWVLWAAAAAPLLISLFLLAPAIALGEKARKRKAEEAARPKLEKLEQAEKELYTKNLLDKEHEKELSESKKRVEEEMRLELTDQRSNLCRYLLAFDFAALLSFTSVLFFFYKIHGGDPSRRLLVLCTAVVVASNLVVSLRIRTHRMQALMASLVAAVILLVAGSPFTGGSPSEEASISRKIMFHFGFGKASAPATVVVTEVGGRILAQQGLNVEPEPALTPPPADSQKRAAAKRDSSPQPTGSPTPEAATQGAATPQLVASPTSGTAKDDAEKKDDIGPLFKVSGVEILSRLGTDFVLSCGTKIVTLPKKEVLSWSVVEPNPASSQKAAKPEKQKAVRPEPLPCEKEKPRQVGQSPA